VGIEAAAIDLLSNKHEKDKRIKAAAQALVDSTGITKDDDPAVIKKVMAALKDELKPGQYTQENIIMSAIHILNLFLPRELSKNLSQGLTR
jgi:hypothetical protein